MSHHRNISQLLRTLSLAALVVTMSGCDGCGCIGCGADVKVDVKHESGQAVIQIRNLTSIATPGATKSLSIAYAGSVVAQTGDAGDGSFSADKLYEITPANVTPSPSLSRVNLRPGRWRISVVSASWNATCEGTVPTGKSATFIFTYGAKGCVVE